MQFYKGQMLFIKELAKCVIEGTHLWDLSFGTILFDMNNGFFWLYESYIFICMYVCAVGNLFEVRFKIFLSLRVRLWFMCKFLYLGGIVNNKFGPSFRWRECGHLTSSYSNLSRLLLSRKGYVIWAFDKHEVCLIKLLCIKTF